MLIAEIKKDIESLFSKGGTIVGSDYIEIRDNKKVINKIPLNQMKEYRFYNLDGDIIHIIKYDTFELKGKDYIILMNEDKKIKIKKVVDNKEKSIVIQKTQVKSYGGLKGLLETIKKNNHKEGIYNTVLYSFLKKMIEY